MIPALEELEILAARLRARVAERRYVEARTALETYCGRLRETAASLTPGDPRLGKLAEDWRRFAEEIRQRVLAGRAHAAARLLRLSGPPGGYVDRTAPRCTWRYFA
ncbi:MAG: hypothetical protein ACLP59_06215 [Bryobacteraceae bacterium]